MVDLQPLLDLAEGIETSDASILGIPQGFETIVDPQLLQSLGELGLTSDLSVLGAIEDATGIVLNAGEKRKRLRRQFGREQELTGADLSGRGIFIDSEAREEGLVADVALDLGVSQGERLADFDAAVGTDLRNLLIGLGQGSQTSLSGLGSELFGSVQSGLQGLLDQQQQINDSIKTVS